MIRKALYTTAVLLALHMLFVWLVKPDWKTGQHQWQENMIKAQDYLYETANPQGAIVGSSLSARLEAEQLPEGFSNLALGGLSIYDGIKVVLQHQKIPKVVCIETNLISRPPSQDFANSLLSPIMDPVRRTIPSLREKNQPAGLMIGGLLSLREGKKAAKQKISVPDSIKRTSDPVFDKVYVMAEQNHSQLPDPKLIAERITELKRLIDKLETQQVQILFFEMPVSQDLCDSKLRNHIRETMAEHFPSNKYTYLPKADCALYATTDAAHLDPSSAVAFTGWLASEIEQRVE